jgi:DNA-binding LacI/PurR family transcriptional regulator
LPTRSKKPAPFASRAAQLGPLRIPEDLSVIMCHEGPDFSGPSPLTTVELGIWDMSKEAVDLLVAKIGDPDQEFPARVYPLACSMVPRVRPPRQSPNKNRSS